MALNIFSAIKRTFFILVCIMPLYSRGTHLNASLLEKSTEHFGHSASPLGEYPTKDIFVGDTGILHSLASNKNPSYEFDRFFGEVHNIRGYRNEMQNPEPYLYFDNPHVRDQMLIKPGYDPADIEESFVLKSGTESNKAMSPFGSIKNIILQHLDNRGVEISRQFSSMTFPSIEAALLSLAFLTFAVFLIDLVQDLLRGTSTGRKHREDDSVDDGMTDLIVLALSSIDTLSFGSQNPNCGQKLLCHLNRSGWHDGLLGTASNYFVSLILSVFSPKSGFQNNLDAAQFGKESDDCTDRYSACPSILADLLPT